MFMRITIIFLSISMSLHGTESFNSYAIILPSDPKENAPLNTQLNKIAKEHEFIPQGNKHMTLLLFKIKSDYRQIMFNFLENSIKKGLSDSIERTKNKVSRFTHFEQLGNYLTAIFESSNLVNLRKKSFDAIRTFFISLGFIEKKEDRDKKGIWYVYYDAKTGKQTGELLESFLPHVSFIFLNPVKANNTQKVHSILSKKIADQFNLKAPIRISEKPIQLEPSSISITTHADLLKDLFELKNELKNLSSSI